MKSIIASFLSVLSFSFLTAQIKPATNALNYENDKFSRKQLDVVFKNCKSFPNNTQLSLAIIKNEAVVFLGVKRINDSIVLVENEDKVFEIGSISKVFTSTLLSTMVVNKEVSLDDSFTKHIDDLSQIDTSVSLMQLSNHTSGFPRLPSNLDLTTVDIKDPYKGYGESDLISYLKLPSNYENLNNVYGYSNLGAGLLGYTLTRKSNETYDTLLQNLIFKKYNMTNSTASKSSVKNELVLGLDASGKETLNWDFNVLVGAGGIFSNVIDLSNFALAQFDINNEVLRLTHQPTYKINDNMSIGLGWHVIKTRSGSELIWHNGGTGGYSSSMVLDLDKKNAVIILSNVSAFNPKMANIDTLCFSLITTLKE